jgi:hypothetical protein
MVAAAGSAEGVGSLGATPEGECGAAAPRPRQSPAATSTALALASTCHSSMAMPDRTMSQWRTKKVAAKVGIVALPQTLDMLEPGIVVLQGPPASGQMTFVLQALLSTAYEKNLAVGYVSDAHPTFVARQLQAMAFHLGITIKNICLFPARPYEGKDRVQHWQQLIEFGDDASKERFREQVVAALRARFPEIFRAKGAAA